MSASSTGEGTRVVWQNQIEQLFAAPYWIPLAQRQATAEGWRGCMTGYGIDLAQYDSVKQWAVLIYHYLHSREMPLTSNPQEYWPDEALELLRAWINDGCPRTLQDTIVHREILPPPLERPLPRRIRKDICSLTQAELDDYRARLDDILQVANPDPNAPGQQFSSVHGDWCLHYQEAFLLWHRAYLIRFEQVLGYAVPYWNWMADDAAIDGSPNAGIPQAFKDFTYVHPGTGEERPNPLRFAAAWNGRSKACKPGANTASVWGPAYAGTLADSAAIDCRWVQRDPLLYTTGDDHRAERARKIAMVRIFQEQVVQALTWPTFSQPEGWPGYPWANIQTFDPPQPDALYPNRTDFDGLYEQPHDNFHGWVGPDMADNAYTAFDPIFWSYHANIDRMCEVWLRAHPAAQFTSGFPLHPFAGPDAGRFEFDDPRRFVYTTIGDMARDSRALGYDYASPATPDFTGTAQTRWLTSGETSIPSAKNATAASGAGEQTQAQARGLYVVFEGVRCTHDSYTIDVFIDQDAPSAADVDAANPHYVGRLTRLGMGMQDDKGRCIQHGVTRVLDASANGQRLGLQPEGACMLHLRVTNLTTGEILAQEAYRQLPGFEGRLIWGRPWPDRPGPMQAKAAAPAASSSTHACCAMSTHAPANPHAADASSTMPQPKGVTSMTTNYVFNTPALQGPTDYKLAGQSSAALTQFLQAWNDNLSQWTAMSIIGNPWSNENDAPRAWYFNPVTTGWPASQPVPIHWTPFPNRLPTFFSNPSIVQGKQLSKALSPGQLYQLADTNSITVGGQTFVLYSPNPNAPNVLQIPATKCPNIDWSGEYIGFTPNGPRGWLDEYCEWSITWANNQPGTVMQSVMFTCENPAYWLTMWNQDPNVVLQLYRLFIDSAVQLSDLYLYYPAGSPQAGQVVVDPTTGNAAYNPTNKWNAGTLRLPGVSGGAMHLTSPPNTLSAEVYLAAASTIQRQGVSPTNPQALICCAQYGQSFRNSDPTIGASGNRAAATNLITLADPVGLYIQTPNWSLFKTPDGTPASDFWTVQRGSPDPAQRPNMDSILQAVFEVPASKGYTMRDIQVTDPITGNSSPLLWAGQIAKAMQIALRVQLMSPGPSTPPNTPMSCVASQPDSSLQPWPAQFVPGTLFYGNSPTDLPSRLAAGTTVSMALVVQGAAQGTTTAHARVQFDNPGVTAQVTDFIPNAGAIPGLTNAGGTQAFLLNVIIAPNAAPGPLGIRALNPYESANPPVTQHPYEQGLGMVVASQYIAQKLA